MKTYEDIATIYKALSDPNRLRILALLRQRKLCVCEIREILGLATSTVSKHLSILSETGLILQERDGKWINYFINPKPDDPKKAAFLASLEFWIDNEQVKADSESVKKVERARICSL